jgi:nucleotide-binding universal stress UspA family protein
MNTILIAVDGSQHADKSLLIAASLALQNESQVIVLYATEEKAISKEMQLGIELEYADQIATRLRAIDFSIRLPDESQYARTMVSHSKNVSDILNSIHGEMILGKAIDQLHGKGIKSVKAIQVEGNPADCIIETSEHHKVDTIVMGCRGVGKLQGIVLGSTSQSVAHLAKCSVVIVK